MTIKRIQHIVCFASDPGSHSRPNKKLVPSRLAHHHAKNRRPPRKRKVRGTAMSGGVRSIHRRRARRTSGGNSVGDIGSWVHSQRETVKQTVDARTADGNESGQHSAASRRKFPITSVPHLLLLYDGIFHDFRLTFCDRLLECQVPLCNKAQRSAEGMKS